MYSTLDTFDTLLFSEYFKESSNYSDSQFLDKTEAFLHFFPKSEPNVAMMTLSREKKSDVAYFLKDIGDISDLNTLLKQDTSDIIFKFQDMREKGFLNPKTERTETEPVLLSIEDGVDDVMLRNIIIYDELGCIK